MIISNRWDGYFYEQCHTNASMSRCLSRQIGAVLVRDNRVVSAGWNGVPEGVPHCDIRHRHDSGLASTLMKHFNIDNAQLISPLTRCPRHVLGAESGTMLELCPAVHAEVNAVINAARKGSSTIGCTLYMNCTIPCRNCLGVLINAGVRDMVVSEIKFFDKTSEYMFFASDMRVRVFDGDFVDKYKLRYSGATG